MIRGQGDSTVKYAGCCLMLRSLCVVGAEQQEHEGVMFHLRNVNHEVVVLSSFTSFITTVVQLYSFTQQIIA